MPTDEPKWIREETKAEQAGHEPRRRAASEKADKRPQVLALAQERGLAPQFDQLGRLNPNYWKFAAAKASKGWQDTDLITEEDLDKAIEALDKNVYR